MPPTESDRDSEPPGTDRDAALTEADHDRRTLERRLEAVERALAEEEPLERADRLDELESRVAELEAAVQALRGYVGSVRAVNEEIELRADRALRKAEAVERNVAPGRADRGSDPDAGGDRESATGSASGRIFGTDADGGADDASGPPVEERPNDRPTPLERLRERL